jgi:hypothetical protein
MVLRVSRVSVDKSFNMTVCSSRAFLDPFEEWSKHSNLIDYCMCFVMFLAVSSTPRLVADAK